MSPVPKRPALDRDAAAAAAARTASGLPAAVAMSR